MKEICSKALEIFAILYPAHIGEFNASRGWFWRFVKRANLSRRCPLMLSNNFVKMLTRRSRSFGKQHGTLEQK